MFQSYSAFLSSDRVSVGEFYSRCSDFLFRQYAKLLDSAFEHKFDGVRLKGSYFFTGPLFANCVPRPTPISDSIEGVEGLEQSRYSCLEEVKLHLKFS